MTNRTKKNKIKSRDIYAPVNQNCKFNLYFSNNQPEYNFIFTVPVDTYPTNHFIGREKELSDIQQHIKSGDKLVLVSGIGGIGKTHLCRYLFRDFIKQIKESGDSEIKELGYMVYSNSMDETVLNSLHFSRTDDRDADIKAAWFYIADLAIKNKIVIFIDNIYKTPSEDSSIKKLFSLNCSVVATSRKREFERFVSYELDCLEKEECKQLFENIYGIVQDQEELEFIVEVLAARHTKTIDLLARLAKSKNWSVKELSQSLKINKFNLSLIVDGEQINIQAEYKKLFDLANLSKTELNILEAFSLFSPLQVPRGLCHTWMDADARVIKDDEIYDVLYLSGWLEKDELGYYMHPIIAETIKTNLKAISIKTHKNLISTSVRMIDIEHADNIKHRRDIIPFVNSIVENIWEANANKLFLIANMISDCYNYLNDTNRALVWKKRALSICSVRKKKDTVTIIILSNEIGQLFYGLGNFDEAFKWHKDALKLCARLIKEKKLHIAKTCEYLSSICISQCKYPKAKVLIEKAYNLIKELYGENSLKMSGIYNQIADIYMFSGEFDAAIENMKKSLMIVKQRYGRFGLAVSHTYNNLASIYKTKGDFDKAQILFYKALIINKRFLEEDNLEIGINYNNIALIYYYQFSLDKAFEYHAKALMIKTKHLGENHPFTATTLNNIGLVFAAKTDYENAIEWLESSLKIREAVFGKNHELTIESILNIAEVYIRMGDYDAALQYAEAAQPAMNKIYAKSHHIHVVLKNIMSDIYMDKKDYSKALTYLKEATEVINQLSTKDHPKNCEIYNNLSRIYVEWGQYRQAAKWVIEAYDLAKSKYGQGHIQTQTALRNAIGIFDQLGKSASDCLTFINSPLRNYSML